MERAGTLHWIRDPKRNNISRYLRKGEREAVINTGYSTSARGGNTCARAPPQGGRVHNNKTCAPPQGGRAHKIMEFTGLPPPNVRSTATNENSSSGDTHQGEHTTHTHPHLHREGPGPKQDADCSPPVKTEAIRGGPVMERIRYRSKPVLIMMLALTRHLMSRRSRPDRNNV